MSKTADKLRTLAANLERQVAELRRPMTQNPTPKRMREYNSRLHDGRNLEECQRALRALADAHDADAVPPALRDAKLTKGEILRMVSRRLESESYYHVRTGDYHDNSEAARALRSLIDGAETPAEKARRREAERAATIARLESRLVGCDLPGFFPTPKTLAARVAAAADVADQHRVLEPSAGTGSLVAAVLAACPAADVRWIELRPSLQEILRLKFPGRELPVADFLEADAGTIGRFDRVVMNPPFERCQDVDHVRRACGLLNPGGRLVAIMGEGAFFGSQRKAVEFRAWLAGRAHEAERLPADSFKESGNLRVTGVAARLVVIEADVAEGKATPAAAAPVEAADGPLRQGAFAFSD